MRTIRTLHALTVVALLFTAACGSGSSNVSSISAEDQPVVERVEANETYFFQAMRLDDQTADYKDLYCASLKRVESETYAWIAPGALCLQKKRRLGRDAYQVKMNGGVYPAEHSEGWMPLFSNLGGEIAFVFKMEATEYNLRLKSNNGIDSTTITGIVTEAE